MFQRAAFQRAAFERAVFLMADGEKTSGGPMIPEGPKKEKIGKNRPAGEV